VNFGVMIGCDMLYCRYCGKLRTSAVDATAIAVANLYSKPLLLSLSKYEAN